MTAPARESFDAMSARVKAECDRDALDEGRPQHSVICSWCLRVLTVGDPCLPTSHGICSTCALLMEAE